MKNKIYSIVGIFNQEDLTISTINSCLGKVGDKIRVNNNFFKVIETNIHNIKDKITTKKLIVDVIDNKPIFQNIFEFSECQLVEPKLFDCDLSIFEIKQGDLVYLPFYTINQYGKVIINANIDGKFDYQEYLTTYDENYEPHKFLYNNKFLIKYQTSDKINGFLKNNKFYTNE
jgi:hypothetical protein